MSKLTDTQLIVLSSAAADANGAATFPTSLPKVAIVKVSASLIKRKLMREVLAKPGVPVWRHDEKGRPVALVITRAGRDAIGVEEEQGNGDENQKAGLAAKDKSDRPANRTAKQVTEPADSSAAPPREGSKQALILSLLQKKNGASIESLMAATGWLPHTTRAALTGLRKRAFEIERFKDGESTAYRIAQAAETAA